MDVKFADAGTIERYMAAFATMREHVKLGTYRFPSTSDTAAVAKALVSAGADLADVVVAAQQDWFRRGQTGCAFARLVAIENAGPTWPYVVVDTPPLATDWAQLDLLVDTLCGLGGHEVASILFVAVASLPEFVHTLVALEANTSFWCSYVAHSPDLVTLELRREVAPGVSAWAMAFGPDEVLPATRRSPYFEIAIRVKSKSGREFRRLNPDRTIAHLADVPMEMPDKFWVDRWDSTEHRTESILGHKPNSISAAKSTLTVPQEMLDSASELLHSKGRHE